MDKVKEVGGFILVYIGGFSGIIEVTKSYFDFLLVITSITALIWRNYLFWNDRKKKETKDLGDS